MRPHEFWALYRAVYRRRGLLAAIVGATLLVVGAGCALMPRYYRASAEVMPSEAALSRPVYAGPGLPSPQGSSRALQQPKSEELFATLIGMARTGEVREKAIMSLGLNVTASDLDPLVQVEPGQGTIIRITALARTREGSISLANALAHGLVERYREITNGQARDNRVLLEKTVEQAERRRNEVKVQLQDAKSREGEAALPVGTAENPFLTQFYSQRSELDATRSQLSEVEGRLAAIRTELLRQPTLRQTEVKTSENPVVKTLRDEQGRLERELLLAQTRYTDKHRKVIELKTQLDDVKQRISRESGHLIASRTVTANPVYEKLRDQIVDLQTERQALSSKLQALAAAMSENEQRAGKLADSSVVLAAKSAEYEAAQARYQGLKDMLDSARLEEDMSSSQGELNVLDEAKSAVGPVVKSGPTVAQLFLLGLVLSVGLGLGTVLGLAFLDTRVRGRSDLLRELELPVPAIIPSLNGSSHGVPLARITDLQPLSPHAEAYRFLRAQVVNRNGGPPLRTLLVATARPGQGGSSTAVNLALSLAEIGERVVLVDADLRRPSLHGFFGQDNEAGLTSVLGDGGETAQALHPTDMPNLLLLPAGPPSANPAALLSSARMRHLLAQLKAHSDYVVIDSPSAGAFADGIMLGPLVDGVILVTRANQVLREAEHHTRDLFKTVGANVVGVVLNDAPVEEVDTYHFHQSYYRTALALPPGPDAESAVPVAEDDSVPANGGATMAAAPTVTGPSVAAVSAASREEPVKARAGLTRRQWTVAIGVALLVLALGVPAQWYMHRRVGQVTPKGAVRPATVSRTPSTSAVIVKARVLGPTDVHVEADGKLLLHRQLTAGPQLWSAERELTVWASHPARLELAVNGSPFRALGDDDGTPTQRRFTAEDAKRGAAAPEDAGVSQDAHSKR